MTMKVTERLSRLDIAQAVALAYLGTPYLWGGDDPDGFDCSGFVIEILKSAGILPREGDWTADSMFNYFIAHRVDTPDAGCLVFFGSPMRKTHVEFCLSSEIAIGASGGGHLTTSRAEAMKRNAYIKCRPIERNQERWFIDPFRMVDDEAA